MLVQTIPTNKQIRVAAVFSKTGKVTPVWFEWEGTRHQIQEVSYSWTDQKGSVPRVHFAVWDGKQSFELAYDTVSMTWTIGIVKKQTL